MGSQTPYLDSLKTVLPSIDTPSVKAYEIYRIGWHIRFYNNDSAFVYAERLETFARENELQKDLGRAYDLYSLAYDAAGDTEKSLDYKYKQLEIWETTNDSVNIMYTLKEIADVYEGLDMSSKSMELVLESLSMAEEIQDSNHIAVCFNALGTLYSYQHLYDRSMEFFQKAIDIRSRGSDSLKLYYSFGGIGNLFLNMMEYDSAIHYNQMALDLALRYDRPTLAVSELNNIGFGYSRKGAFDQARDYFRRGLALADTVGDQFTRHRILVNLAYIENQEGNYLQALEYAFQVDTFAQANGFYEMEGEAVLFEAEAEAGLGNFPAAYEAMTRTYQIRDSLIRREALARMAELEVQYDTEQKEDQIALQSDTIARQQTTQKNLIIGSLVLLLLIGGLVQYWRYRQRIKAREVALALELEKNKARQLEEMDRMKSNFFANISHEFRTPLSLIYGPLKDVLDSLPASAEPGSRREIPVRSDQLAMMQRNSLRLGQLVDQLLDLSKLESGNMQLAIQAGDIIQFIRALVFSFESLAERNRISLQTSFPQEPEESWFDADKLEKILVNLLSNAFKFTPVQGTIRVSVALTEKGLEFQVQDSGIGMKPEEVDRIFDRFYQVGSTEEAGSGIGLSLVKELTELYRGSIEVESSPNIGTQFSVVLPYRKADFRNEEFVEPLTGKLSFSELGVALDGLADRKPLQVETSNSALPLALIVEDNADLRHYIRQTIREGYRVLMASDGEEGQLMAKQYTPDLIISDVMMPKMDGFELCAALKKDEHTSHIPVILLTARAGQENKLAGLRTGADDYLTKPFDGKELLIRAKNLVETRRQLQKRFAGQLTLQPSEIATSSADERFLKKVSETIEANMDNEFFSVEDLAAAVAFSRSQLHRKLKAICGKTPNELIRDFRLNRAKSLLEQGAGNVSEISVQVGYNSVSYFTRSFKQAFGYPPSQVQKNAGD